MADPVGVRLRRFGFKIESRPKTGPTLWTRGGLVYPEERALKLIEGDLKGIEGKEAKK